MKTIQIAPTIAFANGKQVMATQFNVVSISDNLFDHVIFKYTLYDENNLWAGESTYELTGVDEYTTWDTTAEGAYTIVSNGIGLTIIPQQDKTLFLDVA